MRKYHYLKPNARSETPRWALFVDTEAVRQRFHPRVEEQHLWFGYAELWRIYSAHPNKATMQGALTFKDAAELFKWVLARIPSKSKVYTFAHNWQYDAAMLSIDTVLPELGFTVTKLLVDSNIFILDARIGNKTLALRDTTNLYPFALGSLGEVFGIPKLEYPDGITDESVWVEYCKRDVSIVREAVMRWLAFIGEHDLGNIQPTLASQAFTAYRHRFMGARILVHANLESLALERDSYHGGRVECFYVGQYNEPVVSMDVNAMYPFVMSCEVYPTKLKALVNNLTPAQLDGYLNDYCVTARVHIDTDEPVYPFKHEKRLIFPVGSFTTTLSTPELVHALERGHVKAVYQASLFEYASIFESYVDYFYALRQTYKSAGNSTYSYIAKLFLNSLYGKFGQSARGWVYSDEDEEPPNGELFWYVAAFDNPDIVKHRSLFGRVQKLIREGESYNSCPAIAAHVTAYARMYLWEIIQRAGPNNVLYCDTDSVFVTTDGSRNIAHYVGETRIGGLKIETVGESIKINGLKDYEFAGKRVLKGISSRAVQIDEHTYRQQQFAKWSVLVSLGVSGKILVRDTVKHLARRYTKGEVGPEGWVTPYCLP